jgi:hypothetical protein
MKKQLKRLTLNRETVGRLDLAYVTGAISRRCYTEGTEGTYCSNDAGGPCGSERAECA